jgi:flagella basal body P-ring formation protein FlgA
MGSNNAAKAAQFAALRRAPRPYIGRVSLSAPARPTRRAARALRAALWLAASGAAQAQAVAGDAAAGGLDEATWSRIRELGEQVGQQVGSALGLPQLRVQVEPGRLNPRLRLAPCERIEPYLPPGVRAWGRSRIGLRCVEGPTPWNVYLPVTVKVFAPAWVLNTPLAAGQVLQSGQLRQAEVDWAAAAAPPLADASRLVGRELARALPAGAALRASDLRQRQWFAAGDTVQLVAHGKGFSVSGRAQAMGPGIEGRPVRVRTDNGRVLSGLPVGRGRVEVAL